MRPMDLPVATDQLSLDLEEPFPHLPATLRPMLARPAPAPFDSRDHLFEPAWGGRRVLAFVEAAVSEDGSGGWLTADGRPSVRVLDPRGRDLVGRFPELRALSLRLDARSAVLDGEVIVVDEAGRSDGAGLRARLAGGRDGSVACLVFDLLYLDGRPLVAVPLARRRELLRHALRTGPEVVAVPAIEGEGVALHRAVVAQRLAGVRARVATSPYLPGVRSALWRWIRADVPFGAEATEAAGMARGPASTGRAAGVGPVLAVIRRLPLEEAAPADGLPR